MACRKCLGRFTLWVVPRDDVAATFAARLKIARKLRGLEARELAHLIGKGESDVYRWERGTAIRGPNITNLAALVDALATTADWLLGFSDEFEGPRGDSDPRFRGGSPGPAFDPENGEDRRRTDRRTREPRRDDPSA